MAAKNRSDKAKKAKGMLARGDEVKEAEQKKIEEQRHRKDKKEMKSRLGTDLGFSDKFTAISIRYFGRIASKIEKSMPTLGEEIMMSNYFQSPNAFLSIIMFVTMLSIPVAIIGPALAIITQNMLLAATVIVPIGVFGIGISLPKSGKSGRASAVDGELPFVIGYISVLVTGGVSPINLFRRLSINKLYPACAKEARRIILNVDVLSLDPVTAIERASRYTPNKMLADFLSGYIAILKIGGDIQSFMDQKQKEIFTHRSQKLKANTEFVGTLAEAYLAATVVMGISLFVLQIVSAMVEKGQANFTMMYFYAGIFVPLISGVFLFLLHSMQTKEPVQRIREHIIFLAGLAAVPLMLFVVPLDQPSYMKLGIGLAISTAAPAVMSMIETRKRMGAEAMLPSFILDLAEIRKTGLAPEKCIEQLASRNYGILSKYVQRMATQVSWGVPLNKVLSDFGKDLKSWYVKSIGFILLEVVEVGGGTVGLFGSLAEFSQKSKELDKERRSMFRPYIFLPYIGAILTVATTVLIITMLTTQLTNLTAQAAGGTSIVQVNTDPKVLTEIMLIAAVFQGWMMGIVGGKMAEWSIGAGYKHATALAIICLVTAYFIATYVKI
jgi:archaeal flagellar protein FlaJ